MIEGCHTHTRRILEIRPTTMEAPKTHFLATALFLALMWSDLGMSTVVMGLRVPSLSVADPVPNTAQDLQVHSETKSSNQTGCGQQVADATDLLSQFAPCIPAVSIISEAPTSECCAQLQADEPTCLCSLFMRFRSQLPKGIVSVKKIVRLPKKCGISVPDRYVCDGVAIPNAKSTEVLDFTDTPDTIDLGWLTFDP